MTSERPIDPVAIVEYGAHVCGTCRHSIPSPVGGFVICYSTSEKKLQDARYCCWQVRS